MFRSLCLVSLGLLVSIQACTPKKKSQAQTGETTIPSSSKINPFLEPTSFVHISKAMSGKLPGPLLIKGTALTLSFDANTVLNHTQTDKIKPLLDITFVLDVTSSMGLQLEAARKGFRKFQENLKAQGFDARYSLLTFEDTAGFSSPFGDMNTFQERLAKVAIGDGDDPAEGSLLALQNALIEGAAERSMESVPLIVLVTDAIGHNGGGTKNSRDCSLGKTLEAFSAPYGKTAKFFYSTSDFQAKGVGDCYDLSPKTQLENLFRKIKEQTADSKAYRGQALGWPFQESTLTTELPNLIFERVTEKAIACPARKFSLREGGTVISSGDQNSWTLNDEGNPAIGPVLSGNELNAIIGKELKIDITRCCDETADASGVCKNEQLQSVEFSLQK